MLTVVTPEWRCSLCTSSLLDGDSIYNNKNDDDHDQDQDDDEDDDDTYLYMMTCESVHMSEYIYEGQRSTCRTWFSLPTMWVPGIELSSSAFAASFFMNWAILSGLIPIQAAQGTVSGVPCVPCVLFWCQQLRAGSKTGRVRGLWEVTSPMCPGELRETPWLEAIYVLH